MSVQFCSLINVHTFINEQKAEMPEEAARLADDYPLTHKVVFEEKPRTFLSPRDQNSVAVLQNHQKDSAKANI